MISEVRPCSSRSSARSISSSVGRSMFDVASSRIRIRGSASSARAIEISWRSPADSPLPPSRHRMVEALREAPREAVQREHRRRLGHLLVGRLGAREADVVRDRPREQERILEHDAELAPVGAQVELPQVDSVDAHAAVARVVEPRDQLGQRGFAATGLADQRGAPARRHDEVDPVQHLVGAVREPHTVQLDLAAQPARIARPLGVADVGLGVEHRADLHHRGGRRLQLRVEVGELLQRLEHQAEQEVGGRERPDLAVRQHARAEREHGDRRDHAEELDRWEEQRRDALRVEVRFAVLPVELVEARLERRLATVRLHDRHARHRLGDLRGHRGDPVAHLELRGGRAPLEATGDHDRRRQHDERDHAEPPVVDEHRGDGRREQHAVGDESREALRQHVGDGVDVARQPGDDPARALLGEVAQRERREMVEQLAAQPEHHLLAQPRHAPDHEAEQDEPGDRHGDVGRGGERQRLVVARHDPAVDRCAHEQPGAALRTRLGDRAAQQQHHPAAALVDVAAEAAQSLRPATRQRPRPRRTGP